MRQILSVWLEGWEAFVKFVWIVVLLVLTPLTLGYTLFIVAIKMDDWFESRDRGNIYLYAYGRAYEIWIEFLKSTSLVMLGPPTLGFTWAILFVRNRRTGGS